MSASDEPPVDGEEGPDCPDCGSETEVERNELADGEHTYIIDCPNCEFEIETESNVVADEREY